jgi:hypothetical protein
MTTTFAEDLGDDGDEGATIVIPRPAALGVAPIDPPSDPPDHSPTTPDASCAPGAEELPLEQGLAEGTTAEDDHRATVPTGPPVEHVEQPRDVRPWWRRACSYVARPFVWLWRAAMEPPSPSSPLRLPPPPPVASARGTLLSAGEVADADRGERVLDDLFLLPPAYLRAAELVARYARVLRRDGAHAVLMGRVHLALSRMREQRGGAVVSLRSLRERLSEVNPRRLDRALLDLEAEGVLELLPPSVGAEVGGPVLLDETRGALARIDVRRTL